MKNTQTDTGPCIQVISGFSTYWRLPGLLLCLAPEARAATRLWDGGDSSDSNWRSRDNWQLLFPVATTQTQAATATSANSRKPFNWKARVGWRNLRNALASIWRMRSRVSL